MLPKRTNNEEKSIKLLHNFFNNQVDYSKGGVFTLESLIESRLMNLGKNRLFQEDINNN